MRGIAPCASGIEKADHVEDSGIEACFQTQSASDAENEDVATTVVSVVKMKLSRFCHSPRLTSHINKIVLEMNTLLSEAYAFSNFHIVRLLETGTDVPPLDHNYFYRCLVSVAQSESRPSTLGVDLQTSIVAFDALRPHGQAKICITGAHLNQVVASLSHVMATMAHNHVWTNLEKRLAHYLVWKHPELAKRRGIVKKIVTAIMQPSQKLDVLFSPATTSSSERVIALQQGKALASALRDLAPFRTRAHNSGNAARAMRLLRHILSDTLAAKAESQAKGEKKRWRTFTLLPVKAGYTISYIPFSTMAIMELLHSTGIYKMPQKVRRSVAEQDKTWRNFFNLNFVETQQRRFGGSIVTDGCGVSVVMNRNASASARSTGPSEKQLDTLHTSCRVRVVGIDPGVTDVITQTEAVLEAGRFEGSGMLHAWLQRSYNSLRTKSYGSSRYYEDAKYKTSARRTNAWNAETPQTQDIPPCQVCSKDDQSTFLGEFLAIHRTLIEHRAARGYRNMRFLRYVFKQKAIKAMCDMIAPSGVLSVVGFGDWEGLHRSAISRRTCGPIQELKKRLRQMENVVLLDVDEFLTSKLNSYTHLPMVNMRAVSTTRTKSGEKIVRPKNKVHRVMHCVPLRGAGEKSRLYKVLYCQTSDARGTTCCRVPSTCNRDVNASMNILFLTCCEVLGFPRPSTFCRRTNTVSTRGTARSTRLVEACP